MRPELIVFDLDGTLVDSREDISRACNHMLERAGRSALSVAEVSQFVGDGARALVARALSQEPHAEGLDEHVEAFLDYYTAHPVGATTLMPGAHEALEQLRGFRLAVCTNKPRRTTLAVLSALGLTSWFALVVAGGDVPAHKPDPMPLERLARELGVSPDAIVMVGDGPQDIECARAAGARSVGVRGGMLDEARLIAAEPDVLLDSLFELPALIRRWSIEAE